MTHQKIDFSGVSYTIVVSNLHGQPVGNGYVYPIRKGQDSYGPDGPEREEDLYGPDSLEQQMPEEPAQHDDVGPEHVELTESLVDPRTPYHVASNDDAGEPSHFASMASQEDSLRGLSLQDHHMQPPSFQGKHGVLSSWPSSYLPG